MFLHNQSELGECRIIWSTQSQFVSQSWVHPLHGRRIIQDGMKCTVWNQTDVGSWCPRCVQE